MLNTNPLHTAVSKTVQLVLIKYTADADAEAKLDMLLHHCVGNTERLNISFYIMKELYTWIKPDD